MPLIQNIYLENFRGFKKEKISLSNNLSLIIGKNAAGKTSILEALYILFTGKSFRTNTSKDYIRENQNHFYIACKGEMHLGPIKFEAKKSISSRIQIKRSMGGENLKHSQVPPLTIIQNKHLRLIEGESAMRRDFFNKTMFHVKPQLTTLYSDYSKALSQRNRTLKNKKDKQTISVWTHRLVDLGTELSEHQIDFFKMFKTHLIEYLNSNGLNIKKKFLEEINVEFSRGWKSKITMLESLKESYEKDSILGFTTQGPHRLDLNILSGNKKSISILSRGQQKLLILLIFLSIEQVILKEKSCDSVLLIDDICSELDDENLAIVFEQIALSESQNIVTIINEQRINKVNEINQFKGIKLSK